MLARPTDNYTFPVEGLSDLDRTVLNPGRQGMLDLATRSVGGAPHWRQRKIGEARRLLALSQRAPWRIHVKRLSLAEDLDALLVMRTPVPVRRERSGSTDVELQIADRVMLGLRYRQEALSRPQPGWSFVHVLSPRPVFHAQVADDQLQPLCLGASLPAGIPVTELVIMAYTALSLQTIQIDVLDPGGVMNAEAAVWWQQNTTRIPLSSTPFLGQEKTS